MAIGGIPTTQSAASRYQPLGHSNDSYTAIQNLTNIDITANSVRPASTAIARPWTETSLAANTSMNTPAPGFLQNMLFPRGVKPWLIGSDRTTNDIWPLVDLANVTDLRAPIIAAHHELTAKNPAARFSKKAIVLFTDGIHNCVDGIPSTGVASPNCTNLRFVFNNLTRELLNNSNADRPSPLPLLERDNVSIHVIPFGQQTAPHTLNFSNDPGSENCITDKVARQSGFPFVRDECDPALQNRILSNINNNWGPGFDIFVNYVSTIGLGGSTDENLVCQSQQYALANVAGVGENFYETNTFLYDLAKQTNGLWAPIRPNLVELSHRNPAILPATTDPNTELGQQFALSDVEDADLDGNFNELLPRQCTDTEISPPAPFQRQIFDPWDRSTRDQIIEAMQTILAKTPVILVEELR